MEKSGYITWDIRLSSAACCIGEGHQIRLSVLPIHQLRTPSLFNAVFDGPSCLQLILHSWKYFVNFSKTSSGADS